MSINAYIWPELLPVCRLSKEPPPTGFKLVMSGRYAHTEAYIQRLASSEGFSILVRQDVTVRTEQTSPIAGIVYVLRRDL